MTTQVAIKTVTKSEIYYPETDGLPVAESDLHIDYLSDTRIELKWFFREQPNVYAAGNMLVYYVEGNPRLSFAPDIFVVMGIPNHNRAIYKTWEEGGHVPDVILEITSKSTQRKDEVEKVKLYQQLGVKEYFQYDPTGDYLSPRLKGRWLDEEGQYRTIHPNHLPHGGLSFASHILGLDLHLINGRLRLFDPQRKEYLQNYLELAQDKVELKAVAEQAKAVAQREIIARQRETKARQQAEAMAEQSEVLAQQEMVARQRAEAMTKQEAVARQQAEARLAELMAELQQYKEKLAEQEAK